MKSSFTALYPEQYDKPHNGDGKYPLILTCTQSFIRGKCESGHQFAKALVCGREWCEDCGKKGSFIHQRRIARWWSKAMQFNSMGYLVVTVPEQLRESFKSKKVLSEFRTYVKRRLQRMGYDKGLIRYHWAGDCAKCKGNGCFDCLHTGADRTFKPHLNVLIEEGYLNTAQFEKKFVAFRVALQAWFNKKFKAELNGEKVTGNLWYSYATKEAHKTHKLKYITRATWRFANNREITSLIKGYRTSSTWGKWTKSTEKRVSELVSLEAGVCPCCGTGVTWKKIFIKKEQFLKMNYQHVAGGYFLFNTS